MNIFDQDKLILFLMFVIPGFVCLKTYELISPSTIVRDSSKQIVDAVAYSCVNYGLLFIPIAAVQGLKVFEKHWNLYFIFYFFVLFIFPVILVFLWKWLRTTDIAQKAAPHPTGRPWDFVFSKRKEYWVRVTFKDGKVIGGKYSTHSFASSAPDQEQIYLEEKWIVSDEGVFERPVNGTAGVILLSSDISHVELQDYYE